MFAPSTFHLPPKMLTRSARQDHSDSGLWMPKRTTPVLLRSANSGMQLAGGKAVQCRAVGPYTMAGRGLCGQADQGGMLINRAVLLDALRKEQIQAWLQPKVSVQSRQVVALEALARWRHPQWGVLSPNVFLPWFSEHGLDEALLMHMLQEVLGLQAYWRRQGMVMPVAVNLPTHLLDDAGLPDRLMDCVQAKQGNAADITLELLENSTTRTPCALFMGTSRLVAMGFGLAQDDVGVAHSSMERLVSAPFSELKLDRHYVHGMSQRPEQADQVQVWIAAAKQRGLRVTAEGVQEQADLDCLRQMGCDYAQGYLFAKPTPAFELDMWIRQRGLA